MRKIIGSAFVTLDGVMQAGGGVTEDPSGGFPYGGWLPPVSDDESGKATLALFDRPFDLLLARRTYDIFAAFWPFVRDNPIGEKFARARKYVVTRGDRPLTWAESERIPDVASVARLKDTDGPDLIVQGSTTLYPQLLAAGLIDRLTLITAPVVLGTGKRLFGAGTASATLRMIDHVVSPNGIVVATYEPAGAVACGSFMTLPPNDAERARQKAIAAGTW